VPDSLSARACATKDKEYGSMVGDRLKNDLGNQRIKQNTILSSNSTSRYTPKRTGSRDCNRYLYTHIHNIPENSKKKKGNNPNVHQWVNKQNVEYIYIYTRDCSALKKRKYSNILHHDLSYHAK
jgi:hypothetical protein